MSPGTIGRSECALALLNRLSSRAIKSFAGSRQSADETFQVALPTIDANGGGCPSPFEETLFLPVSTVAVREVETRLPGSAPNRINQPLVSDIARPFRLSSRFAIGIPVHLSQPPTIAAKGRWHYTGAAVFAVTFAGAAVFSAGGITLFVERGAAHERCGDRH